MDSRNWTQIVWLAWYNFTHWVTSLPPTPGCCILKNIHWPLFLFSSWTFCMFNFGSSLLFYMLTPCLKSRWQIFLSFWRLSVHSSGSLLCFAKALKSHTSPLICSWCCFLCYWSPIQKVHACTFILRHILFNPWQFWHFRFYMEMFDPLWIYFYAGWKYGFNFILLQVHIQACQHFLLNKVAFPIHYMFDTFVKNWETLTV